MNRTLAGLVCCLLVLTARPGVAQDQSVKPGINKQYQKPDAEEWAKKWEAESREIYAHREKILAACKLEPGMSVADVGAGSGLFTRLFARAVGPEGKVYAVDIAENFIKYIEQTGRQAGLKNIAGVVCTQDDSRLPPDSVDRVFICDTYHHFEYPAKTMATIHRALKKGGRIVLVEFHRIPGVSREWTMNHVRAGQEEFTKEIEAAGFKKIDAPAEANRALKENYCLVFEKVEQAGK